MKRALRLSVTAILAMALLLTALGRIAPTSALAATTYQLSGRVTDQSGNGLSGTTVAALDPTTSNTVASTTSDAKC